MPGKRRRKPGDPEMDARELYVTKGLSLEDLAKIGRGARGWSLSNLTQRCGKERWVAAQQEFSRKAAAETEAIAVITEAEHRAAQLGRFRKVESAAAAALEKLVPRIEKGARLLGDKQGNVSGLREVTQTLEMAREATAELVDDKDDRFAALLEDAAAIAGDEMNAVAQLGADEDLLDAMQPKGLEELAALTRPKVTPGEPETNGDRIPEPA